MTGLQQGSRQRPVLRTGFGVAIALGITAALGIMLRQASLDNALHGYDTLARFLLAVGAILLVSHIMGAIMARLRQPAVVGEIAGGLLIGPSALGLIWPAGPATLFGPDVRPALDMAAQLGLVFFMFLLGYELRMSSAIKARAVASMFTGAVLLPFLAGIAIAGMAWPLLHSTGSRSSYTVFLGLALSVTALPVMARILIEYRLVRTPIGTLAMATAVIGDAAIWLVLGLIMAASSSAGNGARAVAVAVLFLLFAWLCVRPAVAALIRKLGQRLGRLAAPLILVGAVATASLSNIVGIHPVIGAFIFGLILPRGTEALDEVSRQLRGFTNLILLPLFFAGVGLRCSVALLGAQWGTWAIFGLILLLAVAAKFLGTQVGTLLAGKALSDFSRRDRIALGALMNCRGVTELILATIGLQHHLINELGYTILVLVALITMAMTGPIVRVTTQP